jgi:hypothetical protein
MEALAEVARVFHRPAATLVQTGEPQHEDPLRAARAAAELGLWIYGDICGRAVLRTHVDVDPVCRLADALADDEATILAGTDAVEKIGAQLSLDPRRPLTTQALFVGLLRGVVDAVRRRPSLDEDEAAALRFL